MTKHSSEAISAVAAARTLIDVADADTVYRDVYLRRARAVLAAALPASEYRTLRLAQHQLETAVGQSRSASLRRDWKRVEEITEQAAGLRRALEEKRELVDVGEQVYDAEAVVIDPFSPGMEAFAKGGQDLADVRDRLVADLGRLAAIDPARAAVYGARRAFFAALGVTPRAAAPTDRRSLVDAERLAFEAARRGDIVALRTYAHEILALEGEGSDATEHAAGGARNVAQGAASRRLLDLCPVDLAAPFADNVAPRAGALGLAVLRADPIPEAAPLFDYVMAHMRLPSVESSENEQEGAMKIAALVDEGQWPAGLSEPLKTLVGQLVRNVFINSGGARLPPTLAAESVLIEDFPEDGHDHADSALLGELALARRWGLARVEIEHALLEHGARIVEDRLGLDPYEFRLVCIPPDLYTRIGRDRGWGAREQWTHVDGYQMMKGGRLRALAGGDVRYGGLVDLVSIATTDQRQSVVARFAVIRRARQVARWR